MKAAHKTIEFRSFLRILRGAALLVCLAIAARSTLRAAPGAPQAGCQQGIASFSLDKGSIIALTTAPTGLATGTVTLNCNFTGYPSADISDNSGGILQGGVGSGCSLGTRTCTFTFYAYQVPSTTSYTLTASFPGTNSTVPASLTVVPLMANVTVSG